MVKALETFHVPNYSAMYLLAQTASNIYLLVEDDKKII